MLPTAEQLLPTVGQQFPTAAQQFSFERLPFVRGCEISTSTVGYGPTITYTSIVLVTLISIGSDWCSAFSRSIAANALSISA